MEKQMKSGNWAGTEKAEGRKGGSNNVIGIAALVVGVIFVVLAGAIFATTTWQVMSSLAKVLTIFAVAVLFFSASIAAERILRIHRTSNACYLLGCIFLFFTVIAAGCFKLLGPLFSGEEGTWRIFSVGGVIMAAAMFLGIRRFSSRYYTQACLWSISLNVALLLKAAGFSDAGTVQGLAVYASLLAVLAVSETGRRKMNRMVDAVYDSWSGIQFMILTVLVMVRCWGAYLVLLFGGKTDYFGSIGGSVCSMAAITAAGGILAWKKERKLNKLLFQMQATELIHISVLGIPAMLGTDVGVFRLFFLMAVSMALFFLAGRRLFPGLCCMAGELLENAALLCDVIMVTMIALLCPDVWEMQAEAILSMVLLACVIAEWGKTYRAMRMMIPLVLWYVVVPLFYLLDAQGVFLSFKDGIKWLTAGYVGVLMVWDMVKQDVFAPGIAVISGIMLLLAVGSTDAGMQSMWFLLIGLYLLRFARSAGYRRQALTASMILVTAAYLRQPWIRWPEILELELYLLPVAGNLYGIGRIWGYDRDVEILQTAGYVICLLVLGIDAVLTGQLVDALILEGICLAVFLLAHLAGSRRWVRISGGFLLAVAIYMTKDFWLSIAWWVYLMAAGIGLILFAAVREKNRRQEDEQE